MNQTHYRVVTLITAYRIAAAPILLFLVITHQHDVFKWLLCVSFFTDLIDGTLARMWKVTSVFGTKLDSIGDDLTVLVAIIGAFVFKNEFLKSVSTFIIILFALFIIQTLFAIIRYKKVSSFHTYLAKAAAILQGTFLILLFLLPQPVYFLFYIAAVVTILELVEEIILVALLPKWKSNVKGIYWVFKSRN